MPVRYNSYGADWFILSTEYAIVDEVAISILPYDSAYEVHPINLSIFPCHRYFVFFLTIFPCQSCCKQVSFFPNYGIWEQAWLSLFYHRFILVWFAFEVRPQHMLWLILDLLWYFYSKFIELMHLTYGVTQTNIYILSFMLFLVNWGAWHMQWWPTFLSL
jgi:hypothetical protein